jgi:hypothetical protein
MGWYAPTKASWPAGTRDAMCVLNDPAGRLVRSMRGSRL